MSNALILKQTIMEKDEPQYVDEDLEFVDEQVDSFRKYFNAVYEHVEGSAGKQLLFNAGRITGEQLQDFIMKYNSNRRSAHNLAIDACAKLNRLCEQYNVEKFCPEIQYDKDNKPINRAEVADFVGKYVYDVYQRGIHKEPIQEIARQKNMQYGDRTLMDAAFDVAVNDNRNPSEAYSKNDAFINPDEGFKYNARPNDIDLNYNNYLVVVERIDPRVFEQICTKGNNSLKIAYDNYEPKYWDKDVSVWKEECSEQYKEYLDEISNKQIKEQNIEENIDH